MSKYTRAKRAEWFAGKVCFRCGAEKNLRLRSLTGADLHSIWTVSKVRREQILLGCVAMCPSCHYRHVHLAKRDEVVANREYRRLWKNYWRHCRWVIWRYKHVNLPVKPPREQHVFEVLDMLANCDLR